jgi:hypothetical protein
MKMPASEPAPLSSALMISLGDIAFLIIFFFMLAPQFMRERAAVRLPELPKAGLAVRFHCR